MTWWIIVNENMHDAAAWIEPHEGDGQPQTYGWERAFSCHETREQAEAALPQAKKYVAGRTL